MDDRDTGSQSTQSTLASLADAQVAAVLRQPVLGLWIPRGVDPADEAIALRRERHARWRAAR